jgi:hypothetical protein
MITPTTGQIVDAASLGQLSDANGTKLVFTKTVGTANKISQGDFYTATGTPTAGSVTWAYTAEALPTNPTQLYVTVKKTKP